jgi:hypothetical protein
MNFIHRDISFLNLTFIITACKKKITSACLEPTSPQVNDELWPEGYEFADTLQSTAVSRKTETLTYASGPVRTTSPQVSSPHTTWTEPRFWLLVEHSGLKEDGNPDRRVGAGGTYKPTGSWLWLEGNHFSDLLQSTQDWRKMVIQTIVWRVVVWLNSSEELANN